eukprot:CAMPEP_0175236684 /NCGR_PEP_ID=MMETSP0093-20121207/28128_1 /TAXON_ID=311494 /ORGANISM="Alexandrium monilatum, Strain CCMP3105" /LENGTH=140 /DNA_ID=CAMNT_0016530633 /DNA_START=54 /DNA_END=474 /DNA_ORIENTATION=+
MPCEGGEEAACHCLLRCQVFGADPGKCDISQDQTAVVDAAVQKALKKPGNECDGMGCVVACAKDLGCLDEGIKRRCERVKEDNPQCQDNCSGSLPSAGSGAVALLVSALLAAAAALSVEPAARSGLGAAPACARARTAGQ